MDTSSGVQVSPAPEVSTSLRRCTLGVGGMTCSACVNSVTAQLEKLPGVRHVAVSLSTAEAKVEYTAGESRAAEFAECVEDCGFDAAALADGTVEVPHTGDPLSSQSSLTPLSPQSPTDKPSTATAYLTVTSPSDNDGDSADTENARRAMAAQSGVHSCEPTPGDPQVLAVEYAPHAVGIRTLIAQVHTACGVALEPARQRDRAAQLARLARDAEIAFWRGNCTRACLAAAVSSLLYMGVPMAAPGYVRAQRFPYSAVRGVPGLFYRDVLGALVATYALASVGRVFYAAAWKSWRASGSGTMDTLVAISTFCAYAFSLVQVGAAMVAARTAPPAVVFDTAVMLVAFVSVGKFLENRAKAQTSSALSRLVALAPAQCTVRSESGDGDPRTIPVELLQLGDTVEVLPGATIPADGTVTHGESEVDESLLTGESRRVHKRAGTCAIAGSINGPGHLRLRVTAIGGDTQLAKIIDAIKNAQLEQAPIQQHADRMCAVFVPTILLLSLFTFILWYALASYAGVSVGPGPDSQSGNGSPFFACLRIATSVIIVACPCALGLATPTAIMVGTGVAAQHGVLVKNGAAIESSRAVRAVVFDKTGTLTAGNMSVRAYIPIGKVQPPLSLWPLVRACEELSEHPVARAIVAHAAGKITPTAAPLSVTYSEVVLGQGVRCLCSDGVRTFDVRVGTGPDLLGSAQLQQQLAEFNSGESALGAPRGATVAYVAVDDTLVGKFELEDRLRDDAQDTVQHLRAAGYRVYIVTGDNRAAALKVAAQLGVDPACVHSGVPPQGKCEIVKQLQAAGEPVAFVGDGINDSPALVTATLGIAISTGTDIAIDAADIVVMGDDSTGGEIDPALGDSDSPSCLTRLVYALDISQRTYDRIRLNLFWAFSYNSFMVPIAMGVLVPWGITLPPMVAGLAMALSSVSVVLSSLRLKSWQPPRIAAPRGPSRFSGGWFQRLSRSIAPKRFAPQPYAPLRTDDIEMQSVV